MERVRDFDNDLRVSLQWLAPGDRPCMTAGRCPAGPLPSL